MTMLAPLKSLIVAACLLITVFLYDRGLSSSPAYDVVVVQSNTPDPVSDAYGATIAESNNNIVDGSKPSKIIQATMMFGHNYKGLNERTLQSHVEHAKRWGYGDHILTREVVGARQVEGEGEWNRYIFSKILYILKLMVMELERPREERAEWIVWYDADTLILNPNIPWESFLPPPDDNNNNSSLFSDIKILATKDISGFNAGLFFCRVDEWVVDVLADSYALPRLHPEIDISGNIEQNAMKWIFSQDANRKHVLYQPSHWYNWFSSIDRPDAEARGDMLIHFSGINHDHEGQMKKAVMETWFRKLDTKPAEWHRPWDQTRYPNEIPIFWHLVQQAKYLLSVVKDRGDSTMVDENENENEHGIQIARNELKWTVEEEAFDVTKMERVLRELMDKLGGSDGSAERKYGVGQGDAFPAFVPVPVPVPGPVQNAAAAVVPLPVSNDHNHIHNGNDGVASPREKGEMKNSEEEKMRSRFRNQ